MRWIGATAVAATAITLLVSGGASAQSTSMTVYGQAQKLGDGFAQLYAELDTNGAPRVLGVSIDSGMLENLPATPNLAAT